jgi:hypothetical protein
VTSRASTIPQSNQFENSRYLAEGSRGAFHLTEHEGRKSENRTASGFWLMPRYWVFECIV